MIMLIKDIKDTLSKEVINKELLVVLEIIVLKIKDGEDINSINLMVEEKLSLPSQEENEILNDLKKYIYLSLFTFISKLFSFLN
jgi:hypothetical protein